METYINKIKSLYPNYNVSVEDNNIIITLQSLPLEHLQLAWNILCSIYNVNFTKHVNNIIIK